MAGNWNNMLFGRLLKHLGVFSKGSQGVENGDCCAGKRKFSELCQRCARAKMFRFFSRSVYITVPATLVMLAGVYVVLALSTGSKILTVPVFGHTEHHPTVIAHRGGGGLAPENTIEAFRKSADLGADVLELDVHETADGSLVVMHDDKVDRTTNGTGDVSRMALNQVQTLDAGYKFTKDGGITFPFRGKGVKVPTLEEVLGEFPEANFNIEAKGLRADKAPVLCSMIRELSSPERVVIASAGSAFMYEFRNVCQEVPTSATFTEAASFIVRYKIGVAESYTPTMHVLQVPEKIPGVDILSPEFISAARERNLFVHGWTVNDPTQMRMLIKAGIDGIITDRPDILLEILSETE